MKISKKQEKAIDTVVDVLNVILSSGLDSDEDGSIEEAIEVLSKMRDKSILTKAKEKAKKDYYDNLLENSNTVTLDSKWYDENIKNTH